MDYLLNPGWGLTRAPEWAVGSEAFAAARAEIVAWPGYRPTPLRRLAELERELGLARLWYKDEAGRFGLGSFKALGGAYAVLGILQDELTGRRGRRVSAAELRAGAHREATAGIVVATATDGNHGRSVAWGARLFGCQARIFMHQDVSQDRVDAVTALGAQVIRVPGNYDDSVREAARRAAVEGWFVVSDTAYPGYTDVPRQVMAGYGLLADEAIDSMAGEAPPSHLFVQAGCGGLAAALSARFRQRWAGDAPRLIVVEPTRADCVYQTARNGRPTPASGDLDTVQAGLSCGEVSLVAWDELRVGAFAFARIDDAAAIAAMRRLAALAPPVVAGESAVAGLACLAAAMAGPAVAAFGLTADAKVLLIGSEGAVDAASYRRLVGHSPAA
jgi:diaminopropionate ammonia-lyase